MTVSPLTESLEKASRAIVFAQLSLMFCGVRVAVAVAVLVAKPPYWQFMEPVVLTDTTCDSSHDAVQTLPTHQTQQR